MSVDVQPAEGTLRVHDKVRFDEPLTEIEFTLNAGFSATVESGRIERIALSPDGLHARYRVILQTARDELELHYHGRPGFSGPRSHGGMPQGIVAERGVYLDGSSAWYPRFSAALNALRMRVTLPDGWHSVSIGARSEHDGQVSWRTDIPHDDVYLVAGRFSRYARPHGDLVLSVYLLQDDPALAERYLGAIGGYIDHYDGLIGKYPFAKFAVVENPWQTGYGMPSFTLLGSRVLRLPFILYSSLPHEILHNWWGNGVWVDYRKGNWSEGLTAYLSDHWMQARRGKGAVYRLKALQRYSNFAARGDDQPLLEFVSRHSDASQSIGYSKSMMLFHMLRNAIGDEAFRAGLRRLWQRHAFQHVGFADVIRQLAGDAALAERFVAWLSRTGAPDLVLYDAEVEPTGDDWTLRLSIGQQQDALFDFDLPVAVTLQGGATAERRLVRVRERRHTFALSFDQRPLRVDIDPQYDVLRYLDPSEQPPALNRLFGGKQTWLIMPTGVDRAQRDAWQSLADAWSRRYPGLRTIDDNEADTLAADADRMILGWDNAALGAARPFLAGPGQQLDASTLRLDTATHPREQATVVLVGKDADGVTTGFIGADSAAAVAQMARKLPHYGSYGRLVFDLNGKNRRKDTLRSQYSLLTRQLGASAVDLRLTARPALAAPSGR